MPISPPGSTLSIDGNAFIVDSLQYTYVAEPFDRVEFDFTRLRTAPTSQAAEPQIVPLLGGRKAQLLVGCDDMEARPLAPNTSGNVDNIKKRFNIQRYQITAAPSLNDSVNGIFQIASDHAKLLAKFQSHLAKAQLEISYADLIDMQSETFSYLTTTNIDLTGTYLTLEDILITQFQAGIEFEIPKEGGGSTIYQSFSITVENRVITSLSA